MRYLLLILTFVFTSNLLAQEGQFTRADSLRGYLSSERTAFDVKFYHLDIRVDPEQQSIDGSNTIHFKALQPARKIQLDLFQELQIHSIEQEDGKSLPFTREHNAFFIQFDKPLSVGKTYKLKVNYGGKPRIAPRPPWDGGVSWQKDEEGKPWVVVTCQGLGASVWWPNKDHQSDEPDSMQISITVPKGLKNVSNGRLREVTELRDGWTRFEWFVANPINNYNVTMNIGNYVHFQDQYKNEEGILDLDYWVLPYHLEAAKKQFEQVKPMLSCFEKHFGPYPFREDGYKLVESPHPGMEHQSAIAYGNYFKNGYRLRSTSQVGLLFDFIIIHETAHEWFGNSITSADIADMWVHESFGAYLEAVYAECEFGYDAAMDYMYGKRYEVQFDKPIMGTYDVNHEGSGDMYPKGALMLNTIRHACGSDEKWWAMLLKMGNSLKHSIVNYEQVTSFMSKELGRDFSKVFEQYLHHVELPRLRVDVSVVAGVQTMYYRWESDVEGFDLPVKVKVADDKWQLIYPTGRRQKMTLNLSDPESFEVDRNFFITLNKRIRYRLE